MRPLSEEIRIASNLLMVTIGCLLLFSTVSFLYIRGLQSAKGYTLEQLQNEYNQLSSDQRELQSRVQKAQSLTELQDSESIESMTATTENAPTNYVGDASDLAAR